MTTSKTSRYVATLQPKTSSSYRKNLDNLLAKIQSQPDDALIVAPEVVLSGFDYEKMEEAAAFSKEALRVLCKEAQKQTVILTLIDKRGDSFVNKAVVIHRGKVVHEQSKVNLFKLGKEHRYFEPGSVDEIAIFKISGLCIGILICFELRFTTLWERLKGADIIAIPARWGKERKGHLKILSRALALTNQCVVVVSDAADSECAKSSAIIGPNATAIEDDRRSIVATTIDLNQNSLMRRYIRLE